MFVISKPLDSCLEVTTNERPQFRQESQVFLDLSCLSLLDASTPEIADDFARGIVSRGARDTAARMSARTAHIQSVQRTAIVAMAQHGPRREHLVEAQAP